MLVVDLFYHLATLLLALQQTLMLPPRHHYILQYALALHHASWNLDPTDTFKPKTLGKKEKDSKLIPLTSEQRSIVNMNVTGMVGGSDTVRIMAYAGTGKTTTLVELTKRNPNIRFSFSSGECHLIKSLLCPGFSLWCSISPSSCTARAFSLRM